MRIVRGHGRPFVFIHICVIAGHITRRNAKTSQQNRRRSRIMHTVTGFAVVQEPRHKIFSVRHSRRIEVIAGAGRHILQNTRDILIRIGVLLPDQLREDVGKCLPRLIRDLCVGLMDECIIRAVLQRAARENIGNRIIRLLRGVFDVGVVKRLRVLRKRGCVVWDIIDSGLHIRFDRYLWLKADDSLSCQKRIMHILHIRICIFRERFPTVILINGHGIPAQVE